MDWTYFKLFLKEESRVLIYIFLGSWGLFAIFARENWQTGRNEYIRVQLWWWSWLWTIYMYAISFVFWTFCRSLRVWGLAQESLTSSLIIAWKVSTTKMANAAFQTVDCFCCMSSHKHHTMRTFGPTDLFLTLQEHIANFWWNSQSHHHNMDAFASKESQTKSQALAFHRKQRLQGVLGKRPTIRIWDFANRSFSMKIVGSIFHLELGVDFDQGFQVDLYPRYVCHFPSLATLTRSQNPSQNLSFPFGKHRTKNPPQNPSQGHASQEPLSGPFLSGSFSRGFSRGKTAH